MRWLFFTSLLTYSSRRCDAGKWKNVSGAEVGWMSRIRAFAATQFSRALKHWQRGFKRLLSMCGACVGMERTIPGPQSSWLNHLHLDRCLCAKTRSFCNLRSIPPVITSVFARMHTSAKGWHCSFIHLNIKYSNGFAYRMTRFHQLLLSWR